jgi:elongation factor 1-beta
MVSLFVAPLDDDDDLFGDDDEVDEEAERIKAERVAAYNERKAAKAAKGNVVIAKSSILLDVKPWDDETDMAKMEELVRSIEMDGLLWGASKLIAIGYGIKKLQIKYVISSLHLMLCLSWIMHCLGTLVCMAHAGL